MFGAWGGLPGRIWFVYVWRMGRPSGPPVVDLSSGEAAGSVFFPVFFLASDHGEQGNVDN